MGKRQQVKKIVKNSIEIGNSLKKEFDKHQSVLKARTAVNAYRTALAGIIILNK